MVGSTATLAAGSGLLVASATPAGALPGSATAKITYVGVGDFVRCRMYGAGWIRGTITYTVYHYGTVIWRDTRVKYSATSFDYTHVVDCDGLDGPWGLVVDVSGAGGATSANDGTWV